MTVNEKIAALEKYISKAKEEYYKLIQMESEDFGGDGQHYLHVVCENLIHAEEMLACLLKNKSV